jgi:hypothetical protein
MKLITIFFAYLFLITGLCGQSNKSVVIERYLNKNTKDSSSFYLKIQNNWKTYLPQIIEYIDTNKKGEVGFHSDYSSLIEEYTHNNYKGIDAAYLIEFLLAKDVLSVSKTSISTADRSPFNIYGLGVIVKKRVGCIEKKPLEFEDMVIIKRLYTEWWNINKGKTLEQLRDEVKKNGGALFKSEYMWI